MSQKEAPRVGLLKALVAGRVVGREVAAALRLSERQVRRLRRRFERSVGYGPRTLQRALRFQRFLACAQQGGQLARLAADAGYADQAHLTRECGKLAGLTPTALARQRVA